ncbi:MAG: 1-acyl-sn-glycerol-3-phosphate acyltransferase [Spirochaetaceae bacterium]|jgi:1-acyl-sn-glycerol-3-phosphate acyltransferase|nr:1-acyl-sn-glycerol-3-phosphate acyltransferase [Spirochaetaceae bacterium]
MALIKTIAIFSVVGLPMILIVPMGLLIFILSSLGLKKRMDLVVYKIAQFWSLLLIGLTGCKLTVLGRENIPPRGGICFVSNHGSIFDIILLLAYAGRPIGFIAKKELALIPFLNIWILLIGGLFIDRNTVRKAVGTIQAGVERIRAGGAMIIFPEGHRSKGQGLLPFHPGSFKLATRAEAPIVPVAITGSYEVFEKTHRVCALPVRVIFGKSIITVEIPPEERRRTLSDQVRKVISEALES